MNDRAVSLFEKYDVTVEKTRKGRGAIIAETSKGVLALVEYNGPTDHLAIENALLKVLDERFDGKLDTIVETAEQELFCTDYDGKNYIVKNYVEGKECTVIDEEECLRAIRRLAELHKSMRNIELDKELEIDSRADNLLEDFDRRSAELVRARNYMRKVSSKDDFELAFLKSYDRFMEQADMAYSYLNSDCTLYLAKKQKEQKMFSHGDCTHHNILIHQSDITFVNFEKVGAHLQLKDVYLFMRKILEKNNWSDTLGFKLLEEYDKELALEKEERQYLYARFLFPEKYWKVANGYLNRRKSLPARRQQEKLTAFEEKEEKRQLFLNKWLETCI